MAHLADEVLAVFKLKITSQRLLDQNNADPRIWENYP